MYAYHHRTPLRTHLVSLICAVVAAAALQSGGAAGASPEYAVVADGIPAPLAAPGDPARGRAIALDRNVGACVLCHALPEAGVRFMGTLGPALGGVGSRYTAAQLRLRIVDSTRVHRDAAMPAYYRSDGLNRVAEQYRGRTVLTAQQVEDIVAYLQALQ